MLCYVASSATPPQATVPLRIPVMNCDLCGNGSAAVACEDCDSMVFCSACDDMYHRHPKRKFHLRKSVLPLVVSANISSGYNLSMSLSVQNSRSPIPPNPPSGFAPQFGPSSTSSGHPSKMPIPPPRRKKSLRSLSSLDGDVSESLMSKPPIAISNGNSQSQWTPPHMTSGQPMIPSSSSANETRPMVMMTDRSTGRQYLTPADTEWRRGSATGAAASGFEAENVAFQRVLESAPNSAAPSLRKRSSSLPRKNSSLQDVRGHFDPMMLPHPYAFAPTAYPYGPYGPYGPMNPWDDQSIDMEDEELSDEEEEEEDIPPPPVTRPVNNSRGGSVTRKSRKDSTLRSMRGATMPRSISSYQLPIAPWGAPPPLPPPAYYPPFPHPQYPYPYGAPSYYGQPSYTSSPPGSLRSLTTHRRKKSIDMLSNASSAMRQKSYNRHPPSQKSRRRESLERLDYGSSSRRRETRRGGSKPHSVVSSRYESESEEYSDEEEVDEEEDFSMEEELSLAAAPVPISDDPTKPWPCKYCTYVNQPEKEICEICSKSKPKRITNHKKNNAKPKATIDTSKNIPKDELEANEDLVREQMEIEKEMKRRLENEKRVEEHNKKIEEREKLMKEKNENYNPDEDLDIVIDPEEPEEEEKEVLVAVARSTKEDRSNRKKHTRSSAGSDISSSGRAYVGRRRRKGSKDELKSLASSLSSLSVSQRKKHHRRARRSDDEDEDEEETDQQTLEALISSLEKQKLEIQKIEQIISATQAQVNMASPQKSSEEKKAPTPVPPVQPPTQEVQQAPLPNMAGLQSLSFQGVPPHYAPIFSAPFQPQFYDPMASVINPYSRFVEAPRQPMTSLRTLQGSSDSLRNLAAYAPPILPQPRFRDDRSYYGSRCSSREDLLNPHAATYGSGSSGMEMIKLLREAEKKGFSADDVEVALSFSPSDPLEWLDENWSSMVETVLRLANNQIIQNETKKGKVRGRISEQSLVRERDAKFCLRKTKGNVWSAVEKCIQRKEEEKANGQASGSSSSRPLKEKSFTLEFNEPGNGRDNMDMNDSDMLVSYSPVDENEIVDMFIAKWKQEKENEEQEEEDRKMFEVEDDDQTSETEDKKSISAKDRFFSSFEQLQAIEASSGRDLRKYLLNKYFGSDDEDSHQDPSSPVKTVQKTTDINEREDGSDIGDEDSEKVPITTKESRTKFFQGKNLDEYVADQDASVEDELELISGPSKSGVPDVKKAGGTLGHNFEFLMSLKFDDLDPEETINSLMRAGSKSDDEESDEELKEIISGGLSPKKLLKPKGITTLMIKPEFGIMSRSESPRFKAEPDDKGHIKIIPKTKRKRGIDFSASNSAASSVADISSLGQAIQSPVSYPINRLGDARTYFECELCAAVDVDVENMVTMLSCEHSACIDCMRQYLTLQIRERQSVVIPCPFCKEPEISPNDEDKICDYLSLMDQLIRTLLPEEIHSLFQRKIRDRALAKDPSFRWCPNCSSGFIAANMCASTVMCPDCKKVLCIHCNKIVSYSMFVREVTNLLSHTVGTTTCGHHL